jgi:predicted enzyme related to lactoylglutathione lyase
VGCVERAVTRHTVAMRIPSVFIGIAVADLATSAQWYEQFFGRAADVLVSTDEVMWQLNESSWLFIVQDDVARPSANVVLATDDLNDALQVLARHGIEPLELEVIDGAGRKAYFRDPDDNEVVLAEIYAL